MGVEGHTPAPLLSKTYWNVSNYSQTYMLKSANAEHVNVLSGLFDSFLIGPPDWRVS